MGMITKFTKALYWISFGNKGQKRKVKHELTRVLASMLGDFYLSEDHKLWLLNKEFIELCNNLPGSNQFSWERKFLLCELLKFTKNVPGDIAECGCFKGASAYLMAKEYNNVLIHLFDSFEGLSTPTDLDLNDQGNQIEWAPGDLQTTENTLRENLKIFDNIRIYKGWIPKRFKEINNLTFKFVHIDVDLYQPTYDSLTFFYNRVNSGGVILLDDYGFSNCNGAHEAANLFMKDKPEMIIHNPTGQGIILKK